MPLQLLLLSANVSRTFACARLRVILIRVSTCSGSAVAGRISEKFHTTGRLLGAKQAITWTCIARRGGFAAVDIAPAKTSSCVTASSEVESSVPTLSPLSTFRRSLRMASVSSAAPLVGIPVEAPFPVFRGSHAPRRINLRLEHCQLYRRRDYYGFSAVKLDYSSASLQRLRADAF